MRAALILIIIHFEVISCRFSRSMKNPLTAESS